LSVVTDTETRDAGHPWAATAVVDVVVEARCVVVVLRWRTGAVVVDTAGAAVVRVVVVGSAVVGGADVVVVAGRSATRTLEADGPPATNTKLSPARPAATSAPDAPSTARRLRKLMTGRFS
jgi:hypothetical protein